MIQTAASLITECSIACPLGPMTPTSIYDIIIWCRNYERRNKFPCTIERRFAIGFYQIHQGFEWKDGGVNKYESFAAAVCHFFMVAERLGVEVDDSLQVRFEEFEYIKLDTSLRWTNHLLKSLSSAQQQIIYGASSNKTKRKSRFNKSKLTAQLGEAIFILICAIPEEFRIEAFEKASTIMTKELK